MQISNGWALAAGGLLLAGGALFASGERPPATPQQNEQLSALMLAKLASSQKIVSGLVSEDFDQIRKGVEELSRICNATEWAGHKDQIYAHHRTELLRQSQKLARLADDGNLDGVTYTYMHALTTCISCHQYCRDVLKIADEVPARDKVVPIPVTDDVPAAASPRPIRR
jgi:hypothetical protein